MIADRIESLLQAGVQSIRIADVRIGLCYTAVLLETGRAGVAFAIRDGLPGSCCPISGERPLAVLAKGEFPDRAGQVGQCSATNGAPATPLGTMTDARPE